MSFHYQFTLIANEHKKEAVVNYYNSRVEFYYTDYESICSGYHTIPNDSARAPSQGTYLDNSQTTSHHHATTTSTDTIYDSVTVVSNLNEEATHEQCLRPAADAGIAIDDSYVLDAEAVDYQNADITIRLVWQLQVRV